MILDRIIAKKLGPLLNDEVEKAIILLLDHVLSEKQAIFDNPQATDTELRQFQGQRVLVSELKQYKNRIKDGVLRENESKLDGGF